MKNIENHATIVEGFWPDFYARGRFLKYSMSDPTLVQIVRGPTLGFGAAKITIVTIIHLSPDSTQPGVHIIHIIYM